jgi:hypothetical protein
VSNRILRYVTSHNVLSTAKENEKFSALFRSMMQITSACSLHLLKIPYPQQAGITIRAVGYLAIRGALDASAALTLSTVFLVRCLSAVSEVGWGVLNIELLTGVSGWWGGGEWWIFSVIGSILGMGDEPLGWVFLDLGRERGGYD